MSREEVCGNIKFYLEKLTSNNCVVVYDIDDTLICSQTREVIQPVMDTLHHAKRLGYKIMLITARESHPETIVFTSRQLKKLDIPFSNIYFRDSDEINIPKYKKNARKHIYEKGLDIKITVGDMWWDLGDDDEPDMGFIIPRADFESWM